MVYARGNDPASGLFFSRRLFLQAILGNLLQLLKTLTAQLATAHGTGSTPWGHTWQLMTGGGFLGPSRRLFQLHHAASMPRRLSSTRASSSGSSNGSGSLGSLLSQKFRRVLSAGASRTSTGSSFSTAAEQLPQEHQADCPKPAGVSHESTSSSFSAAKQLPMEQQAETLEPAMPAQELAGVQAAAGSLIVPVDEPKSPPTGEQE